MALNTQIRAACLLILLISSLTSGTILQQRTEQRADLQPQHTAEATAGLKPVFQRLRKRDTHLPICIFCCKCCNLKSNCGICCKV
ncbi:hepcidin [Castor canadensis]|uniref:Hepcidin n=1 Tax=Castor canadensis TaxID=51338 RepID=A0A8C0WAJ5_CASCN|nr:hepcidin [Castor canadensis]